MSRPSLDDLKRRRDGTLHPRIAGHVYEGETCPKCAGTETRRLPASPMWYCRGCDYGFIVVSGEAASDMGVPDGTALVAVAVPAPDSEEPK